MESAFMAPIDDEAVDARDLLLGEFAPAGGRTRKSVDLDKPLITDVLKKDAGAEGSYWFKARVRQLCGPKWVVGERLPIVLADTSANLIIVSACQSGSTRRFTRET